MLRTQEPPRAPKVTEEKKMIADSCVDEWWNHVKLGIDTTVDLNDIRHKRPTLQPFQGRMRIGKVEPAS